MKYALKINHPLAFIFKTILKYPKQILFCCILFFFISLFYAIKLPIDASSESLILENDKDFKIYEEILQDYQTKDFLILAFIPKDGNVFSNHSLQILQKITQDIKKIPQVQDTLSILNAPLLKSTPNLELQEILKINPTLLSKQTDKNLAKNEILNHPFYTQNIISKNAKTAGILIYLKEDIKLKELTQLKNTANTKEEKQNIQNLIHTHKQNSQIHNAQTIQALKSLKEQYTTEGKVYLGGIMLIASDMIDYVKSDLITYGTALSIILALMLWIFFRHIYFVALSFCVCLFSLVVSSGIFSFFGYQITIVSSNYVSLLLIISVSLIVHLIVSYLEFYEKFPKASQKNLVYVVMLNKASPSFFAVLTTIIGFLSLVFSKILPIIHLGIIMSIGVSVALIFTFILFGAILVILPKPQKVKDLPKWHHIFLLKCANLATNKPKLIYTISFLCIVFSIYGIMNLKVENSFVNYFKDDSEIKQGLLTIDQDLGGTIPLEIIINFQDKSSKDSSLSDFENEFEEEFNVLEQQDSYWFDSQKLRIAEKIHTYLANKEYIGSILSLHSLSMLVGSLGLGADDFTIAFLYKNSPQNLKNQLFTPYANIAKNQMRFVFRTFDSNPNLKRNLFIHEIQNDLTTLLQNESVTFKINGMMVLYNNLLQSLIASQVDTLSLVIGAIFLVFVLIFRSFKLSVIALLTNLIPLGAIFGFLGISGIPLDLMGITIAAICLGIGVDDVIHYIHRYKEELKSHSIKQAIIRSHSSIGNAMYYTTLIIVVGFCAMMTSNFIPTIYFGLLTTLVMLLMLAGSLILLPTFLITLKK
ncbi:efflux RND transporter permease subunit [Helicobacter pullorum]|uniref:efflux RND transporter permease subunit n=1 Tax=Helicobacter pullorum TaxID=35818 RepID=UPI000AA3F9E3|nr:MMPL family transporter [Helicobacter pullorum]